MNIGRTDAALDQDQLAAMRACWKKTCGIAYRRRQVMDIGRSPWHRRAWRN
jgi:hypothetical protein